MAKLLIIDDSTDLLEMFTTIFTMRGYEIQTATSRVTALTVLSSFVPDVILLDVKLHGEDGRQLCKEIRQMEVGKHIYIILISATPNFLINYKKYLADAVLEKPFDIRKVTEVVSAAMKELI